MAGIWDNWTSPEGLLSSCSIITTPANHIVSNIHDRMPAIISPEQYDSWLNSSLHEIDKIKEIIMTSRVPNSLNTYPVSTKVNKAAYHDESCINPM